MQNIGYVYDTYGRISQVKLGDTKVRDYFYTDGGDLSYTKDYRGFETADSTAYIKESFEYDSIGAVTKLTYTDFANESATTGTKKEEYTLSYDNNGNILTESAYTNYGEAKTINKSYEYDVIGRLTKSTIDGAQTSYTYDKVGNRLSQTSGGKTLTYTYNNLDQLLNIKSGSDTISTFVYDARGNQISESSLAFTLSIGEEGSLGYESKDHYSETEYTYDLRNQLIGVETITPIAAEEPEDVDDITTDTVTTTNKFNAAGKRIERIEDNVTTRFYYSGDALLYSTDELNVLQTENILDPAGSIIASKRFLLPHLASSQEFANKYYFYHYDVRSSVTNIIGPDGNVVKGYEYDDFGNTENTGNNSFINDVTFTSSVSDTQSGLQYMNARFYQPATGRFLSQDTYSGNAYDPWTQNLYSYCGNNPLNYIDPTGHLPRTLENDMPQLIERRKIRINLTEYYRSNRNNYEKGSRMYNYYNESYWRNQNEVTELNKLIGKLERRTNNIVKFASDAQEFTNKTGLETMVIVNPDGEPVTRILIGCHTDVGFPAFFQWISGNVTDNYFIHTHPNDDNLGVGKSIFSGRNGELGDTTVVDFFGAKGIYMVEPTTGEIFLYDGSFSVNEINNMIEAKINGNLNVDGIYDYDMYYIPLSTGKITKKSS